YYRRYALAALTGVVADADDDGNAASNPSPAERKVQAAKATPQPKPTGEVPSQARVREWIGDSAERKEQANATYQKLKTEKKLSGAALWDQVKAELVSSFLLFSCGFRQGFLLHCGLLRSTRPRRTTS